MAEGTKFTEEEMKDISGLQQTYAGIQNALGQVSVARIRLEQQIEDLNGSEDNLIKEFGETQGKERDFVKSINKKYGDGNLDLTTGVFTSKSVEETPVVGAPSAASAVKTDKTL
jgi:hypothetical protein